MNLNTIKDQVIPLPEKVLQEPGERGADGKLLGHGTRVKDKLLKKSVVDAVQVLQSEIVRDTYSSITMPESGLRLDRDTIKKLVESASPQLIQDYKKAAAIEKLAISRLADKILIQRMEKRPEEIKFTELSIASGIMVQRAIELEKSGIDHGQMPDFSRISEWEKTNEADKPVLSEVIDV